MITCYDGHDEVAFDDRTRHCPVCEVIQERDNLQSKIDDLETELSSK